MVPTGQRPAGFLWVNLLKERALVSLAGTISVWSSNMSQPQILQVAQQPPRLNHWGATRMLILAHRMRLCPWPERYLIC